MLSNLMVTGLVVVVGVGAGVEVGVGVSVGDGVITGEGEGVGAGAGAAHPAKMRLTRRITAETTKDSFLIVFTS